MTGLFICPNCLVLTMPLSLGSLSHLTDEETEADVYIYEEVWKEWAASTNGQAVVGLATSAPSFLCLHLVPIQFQSSH